METATETAAEAAATTPENGIRPFLTPEQWAAIDADLASAPHEEGQEAPQAKAELAAPPHEPLGIDVAEFDRFFQSTLWAAPGWGETPLFLRAYGSPRGMKGRNKGFELYGSLPQEGKPAQSMIAVQGCGELDKASRYHRRLHGKESMGFVTCRLKRVVKTSVKEGKTVVSMRYSNGDPNWDGGWRFQVEFDDGAPLEEQHKRFDQIEEVLGVRFTRLETGGKSVHGHLELIEIIDAAWVGRSEVLLLGEQWARLRELEEIPAGVPYTDELNARLYWLHLRDLLWEVVCGVTGLRPDPSAMKLVQVMRLPGSVHPATGKRCVVIGEPASPVLRPQEFEERLKKAWSDLSLAGVEMPPYPRPHRVKRSSGAQGEVPEEWQQLMQRAQELPPRSKEQLLEALAVVPEFHHGEGRREELLGLAQRLTVEWGAEEAQQWLEAHSPAVTDMAGYFATTPTQISPGSIWPFLREHYGTDLTRRDLKQVEGAAEEGIKLTYGQLIDTMLSAAIEGENDELMELRAEAIQRFRRTDAQIEAALFKRHTELETRCVGRKAPKPLDLSKISGVDWLVPGFLPANDLALLYGAAGTGKTTAALLLAKAVLQGTGVLDHEAPAAKGKVLFIASDSGPQPLVAAMQDLEMMSMPEVQQGDQQRFFVWAADQSQGAVAWSADLRGCIELLKFVRMNQIDLVVLDSCKAICRGTEMDYTNNPGVTALLTYLKDVIAPHTSLLLLNHDGTARNATAGAKAWKEIPSVVHQLEIEELNGQMVHERRLWQLRKSRLGPLREFRYQLEDGEPVLCVGEETFGNCHDRLVGALKSAYENGEEQLRRGELIRRVQLQGQVAERTIDNALVTATRAKHPEICRAGRGRYKLAPRIAQSLKGSISNGKEIDQNQVPDYFLSISRPSPDGKFGKNGADTHTGSEVPENFPSGKDGKSPNPSHTNGSWEFPPISHGTLKGEPDEWTDPDWGPLNLC